MREVLGHGLESSVFDGIEGFGESYEFAVAGGSIDLFEMRPHFKAIVEVRGVQFSLNRGTNGGRYDIGGLHIAFFPFG